MRTARWMTTFVVLGALGVFYACGDSAQPLGNKDIVVNDTAGEDVAAPPAGPMPDAGADADAAPAANACGSCTCDPTKNYCFTEGPKTVAADGDGAADSGSGNDAGEGPDARASLDAGGGPESGKPDSGSTPEAGVAVDASDSGVDDDATDGALRAALPLGDFGEPDGAADAGPPPPPCPILSTGSSELGCIPLPAACAAAPTCACLLTALQPQYPTCYLVCAPTHGSLDVYCGG